MLLPLVIIVISYNCSIRMNFIVIILSSELKNIKRQ